MDNLLQLNNEDEFDKRLVAALYRAAELDYADIPSDEELEQTIEPSQHFQRRMRRLTDNPKKYTRKMKRPIYLRVLQNVAAVFIATIILFGMTMAVSPTVRAAVVEFVRLWLEDRTIYTSQPELIIKDAWVFGYIPEGFELTEEMKNELMLFYIYYSDESRFISINISTGRAIIDNENSAYYQTSINEWIADVYEREDPDDGNIIVLYSDIEQTIIIITGSVEINELIKVAENISR